MKNDRLVGFISIYIGTQLRFFEVQIIGRIEELTWLVFSNLVGSLQLFATWQKAGQIRAIRSSSINNILLFVTRSPKRRVSASMKVLDIPHLAFGKPLFTNNEFLIVSVNHTNLPFDWNNPSARCSTGINCHFWYRRMGFLYKIITHPKWKKPRLMRFYSWWHGSNDLPANLAY